MSVFVDTSALYAALDAADPAHEGASKLLGSLRGRELVTHSYVLVEATALVQRRLGIPAVRDLTGSLLRPVRVVWVTPEIHGAALSAVLAARDRGVSLVDQVSFHVMRLEGITTAFAFDADFAAEGFTTLPSG